MKLKVTEPQTVSAQASNAANTAEIRRPVIAFVCDAIYPYSHGGRELRYKELLPRLAQCADIHVYTMHWWDGPSERDDQNVTYHAISPLLPLYKNNRRSLLQALRFALGCLRLLRYDFDVLEADHIPYFQMFMLRAVATIKRKPFIATWHEVWSRAYWCEYLGWAGWAAWAIERLAMRLPDHIIAASLQTAERLRSTMRSIRPITTVPNGIDFSLMREVIPSADTCDLVVVGRLIEHKRIDMLLDVVALLHARGMNITCRIIGDGPMRASLHEKAHAQGLDHAVEFRHDVGEQKELYSLIKSAKLFVSLSIREGFGMAVLEAIGCGVPVLTTSAPDNLAQHLVARYSRGRVCAPTLEAATAAIQELLAESDMDSYRECDSDPWINDYGWDEIAKGAIDVYSRNEFRRHLFRWRRRAAIPQPSAHNILRPDISERQGRPPLPPSSKQIHPALPPQAFCLQPGSARPPRPQPLPSIRAAGTTCEAAYAGHGTAIRLAPSRGPGVPIT